MEDDVNERRKMDEKIVRLPICRPWEIKKYRAHFERENYL